MTLEEAQYAMKQRDEQLRVALAKIQDYEKKFTEMDFTIGKALEEAHQYRDKLAEAQQQLAQAQAKLGTNEWASREGWLSPDEAKALRGIADFHNQDNQRLKAELERVCDEAKRLEVEYRDKLAEAHQQLAQAQAACGHMRQVIEYASSHDHADDCNADDCQLCKAIYSVLDGIAGVGWINARESMPDMAPITQQLVTDFSKAIAEKLAAAEKKYGYTDGWSLYTGNWPNPECSERLMEHLKKGDPRDVAIYCAFLWFHQLSTTRCLQGWLSPDEAKALREQIERQAKVITEQRGLYHEMTATVAAAKDEAKRLEAECAAMREVISEMAEYDTGEQPCIASDAKKVLESTTAGKELLERFERCGKALDECNKFLAKLGGELNEHLAEIHPIQITFTQFFGAFCNAREALNGGEE